MTKKTSYQNMARAFKALAFSALYVCLISGSARAARVYLLIHVEQAETHWGDSDLSPKLLEFLTGKNGLEVATIDDSLWQTSESGSGFFSADYVSRFGSAMGARYVISFSNVSARLETRKGLSAPLLLSRYGVYGSVSGILRIVDTKKGRVVFDEMIEIEKRGPSQWQLLDDNPNSPALTLSAVEKIHFLEKLEWKTAELIADIILKEIRQR